MSPLKQSKLLQGLTILTTYMVSFSSVVSSPVPSPSIVLTTTPILTPLALAFAAVGLPVAAALGAAGVGLGVASMTYTYKLTLHDFGCMGIFQECTCFKSLSFAIQKCVNYLDICICISTFFNNNKCRYNMHGG